MGVASPVRFGQRLGTVCDRLADVVVDRLANHAGGQLVQVGVEFVGEGKKLGPKGAPRNYEPSFSLAEGGQSRGVKARTRADRRRCAGDAARQWPDSGDDDFFPNPGRTSAKTALGGRAEHWALARVIAHANGSASCPSGTRGRSSGGGCGASPCLASNRAMSPCVVAAPIQRMGPPQRLQVSKSARNACLSSQPHRDLPEVCAAVVASPDPNPNSSWSPAASGDRKRDGSVRFGTTRARWRE